MPVEKWELNEMIKDLTGIKYACSELQRRLERMVRNLDQEEERKHDK
jgi:hypothetical protein